ncbi:MAG: GNAT family N-acetyltransferase [Alphaproteobacteria bacterium]|nr:GNAT family N-acetyltransferase [Alphaproteobacteria bacterium]
MASIEVPKAGDYPRINELGIQIAELHAGWRPDIFVSTRTSILQKSFDKLVENKEIYAIYEDGAVIGYMIIKFEASESAIKKHKKKCVLEIICVDKQHRNKGYGKKLFDYAIELARKNGATYFYLDVYPQNASAIALYEKKGLTVEKPVYSIELAKPDVDARGNV